MSESAGELACDSANLNCLTLAQREGAGKHTCGQPKKEKNEQGMGHERALGPSPCVCVRHAQRVGSRVRRAGSLQT